MKPINVGIITDDGSSTPTMIRDTKKVLEKFGVAYAVCEIPHDCLENIVVNWETYDCEIFIIAAEDVTSLFDNATALTNKPVITTGMTDNVALLAVKILALNNLELQRKLRERRAKTETVKK